VGRNKMIFYGDVATITLLIDICQRLP